MMWHLGLDLDFDMKSLDYEVGLGHEASDMDLDMS